jgi:hypothetical protein
MITSLAYISSGQMDIVRKCEQKREEYSLLRAKPLEVALYVDQLVR